MRVSRSSRDPLGIMRRSPLIYDPIPIAPLDEHRVRACSLRHEYRSPGRAPSAPLLRTTISSPLTSHGNSPSIKGESSNFRAPLDFSNHPTFFLHAKTFYRIYYSCVFIYLFYFKFSYFKSNVLSTRWGENFKESIHTC